MRIGLISDTHMMDDLVGMHPEIVQTFQAYEVELILHLGDLESVRVLDVLEEAAPVAAVRDFVEMPSADPRLQYVRRVISVGGKKIAMAHDLSWPSPRIDVHLEMKFPDEPLTEVLQKKFGEMVDIVAFGHTHEELMHWHEGVFFINPGSATRPGHRHKRGDLGTIAIMTLAEDGSIEAEIVKLQRAEAPVPPA